MPASRGWVQGPAVEQRLKGGGRSTRFGGGGGVSTAGGGVSAALQSSPLLFGCLSPNEYQLLTFWQQGSSTCSAQARSGSLPAPAPVTVGGAGTVKRRPALMRVPCRSLRDLSLNNSPTVSHPWNALIQTPKMVHIRHAVLLLPPSLQHRCFCFAGSRAPAPPLPQPFQHCTRLRQEAQAAHTQASNCHN